MSIKFLLISLLLVLTNVGLFGCSAMKKEHRLKSPCVGMAKGSCDERQLLSEYWQKK